MKDPAFLFYPGDYLRDTQCLSEKAQVAYDRILCEHMRNICISQSQLNFFTKKLSDDEKEEILMVLTKTEDGFQIKWVAESIEKRRDYSESRRKNRKKDTNNICKTHDKHMENEIENEIENENRIKEKGVQGEKQNFGPASPKSSDPAEVNFSPEHDPELLAQIAKNTQCPKDQIDHRFSQYRLSCIADNVVRDKKGHIAGFTKWLTTWKTFESKHTHNQNDQSKNQKLNDTKHKLRQMADSYL